ncbi:sporulation initiation factor Spo0A C-terminal domain-containing protein [Blautia schinkii]|nr:sporulation initiation factor Spo0A C-terminal domain-containing protein [Blautia schinkii]
MRKVYGLIRKLGATSKYKGYYFVAEAVKMTMESQEEPMKITKDIYPCLAKKFKSTPMNVEHDIRTVINVCWTTNKQTMEEIAGYSLNYRPTNSEFVDMLAYYLEQQE